jgi:hypothetical protein
MKKILLIALTFIGMISFATSADAQEHHPMHHPVHHRPVHHHRHHPVHHPVHHPNHH